MHGIDTTWHRNDEIDEVDLEENVDNNLMLSVAVEPDESEHQEENIGKPQEIPSHQLTGSHETHPEPEQPGEPEESEETNSIIDNIDASIDNTDVGAEIPEDTATSLSTSAPTSTSSAGTLAPQRPPPDVDESVHIEIIPTFARNCRSMGRQPYPENCEKFLFCTRNEMIINNCPKGSAYNRNIRVCLRDWSSCPHIAPCTYSNQKLTAPNDPKAFLVCVRRYSDVFVDDQESRAPNPVAWLQQQYRVLKRYCPHGEKFSLNARRCVCANRNDLACVG